MSAFGLFEENRIGYQMASTDIMDEDEGDDGSNEEDE
jgi:hypothetical protein